MVYAVFNGVGCGLGYLMGMYITWTYFPNKKSVITGAILFCAGISASILSPIQTRIVNPNNLKPDDPKVVENVPKLFLAQAVIFAVINIVATLISPPPYELKELKKKLKEKKIKGKLSTELPRRKKSSLFQRAKTLGYDFDKEDSLEHHLAVVNRHNFRKEQLETGLADESLRLLAQLDNDRMGALVQNDAIEEEEENSRDTYTASLGGLTDDSNFSKLIF